ncbi:hypothetical protein [Deinococcus rubellus]|uniref:hypothetical protein n=1 Tax=Deinococcus rubellus TaxID=1889240 RepID=UPI0031F03835
MDPLAATLAHSYLRREPLTTATALMAQQARDDIFNRPDPNQPFLGHRILGKERLPSKKVFQQVLRDVAQQTAPFQLPFGLTDGLTHRWYEAIAEGDALTYGNLPQVRTADSVPELYLTGVKVQDDFNVTLPYRKDELLIIPAEVFCLPTVVRAALASGSARISESVIQCCGGVWWMWLACTGLDVPLQVPTRGAIGLDPGMNCWLSGYDDHGPVAFPKLQFASEPTLAARARAYAQQREVIEDVTATLLHYQLVGIEATGQGIRMDAHHDRHRAGFLHTILDQVASAGLRSEERRLVQTPSQFSSSVDAKQNWLPRGAYRPGRVIIEDGQAVDRDILAARNHHLRLREHHLSCPRWWQILPLEFSYLRGLTPTTLVPKPRRISLSRVN